MGRPVMREVFDIVRELRAGHGFMAETQLRYKEGFFAAGRLGADAGSVNDCTRSIVFQCWFHRM